MKLCFICPEYPPMPHGGYGTFVQVMGRALAQAGHQVRVIGLYPPNGNIPEYEEDEGVRVWRLRAPLGPYGWVFGRYRLYREVRAWVKQGEVDVVDAHDPEGWFAGWPRMEVPLMVRAGGSFSYFGHELGQRIAPGIFRLESLCYHRADGWIAKSEYIGKVTREIFQLREGPKAILYNPVNAPATIRGMPERKQNRVVFTGTLTPKKGLIPLIEAWPKVKQEVPAAELYLFGKEGRAANGEPMIAHLLERLPKELHESVKFFGHVTRQQLFEVLGRARVAVFPSYSEGFAWAPLEAMAAACPTIYSKLGSGPELITQGRDGLLIDPREPAEIACALVRVLREDAVAEALSAAGRARVMEAFTLEKLVPLNEKIYRDLIRDFRKGKGAARGWLGRGLLTRRPGSDNA